MRDIKFRAWLKATGNNQGEMLYDCPLVINQFETTDYLHNLKTENYLHPSLRSLSGGYLIREIMQYTGLKDKNGKEIYEEDIVIQELHGKAIVKFGEGTNYGGSDSSAYFYGYYLEFMEMKKDTWGNNEVDSGTFRETNELEVIGNIYENPELIKGVK